MPIFFERFGIILNSGKTPLNCYNKFFRSNKPKYGTTGGELDATYPSTSSCLPTPGNLLDIYKSCSLETFGIHLDTYNSNFLDY